MGLLNDDINLFFKKIGENKIRLFFTVIMFSLSLFLALFFLTLGMNGLDGVKYWYEKNVNYKIIYAEVTESSNNKILEDERGIHKIAAIRNSEKIYVSRKVRNLKRTTTQ